MVPNDIQIPPRPLCVTVEEELLGEGLVDGCLVLGAHEAQRVRVVTVVDRSRQYREWTGGRYTRRELWDSAPRLI